MIYPVTMYSGKCDNCGHEIELGGGEYSAYNEAETVREEMANSEWHIEADKQYCPDCWHLDDDDNVIINASRKK